MKLTAAKVQEMTKALTDLQAYMARHGDTCNATFILAMNDQMNAWKDALNASRG